MKRNDLQEIKGLSIKAITEKIKATKQEIATLILDKNMSKLKDLKSISKKRKNVAQMMTVVRQKQILDELSGNSTQVIEKKEESKSPKEDKKMKVIKKKAASVKNSGEPKEKAK